MYLEITLPYDLLDIQQLQEFLKNYNNRLATVVDGCAYEEISRKLTIVSTEQLTAQDVDDISAALGAYTNPSPQSVIRVVSLGLQKIDVSSNDFRTIFAYEYQRDPMWSLLQFHLKCFSVLEPNTSSVSYTVRIVNVKKNEVIGSNTFTSTDYSEDIILINEGVELGDTQPLEIQVKTTTPGIVSVLSTHIEERAVSFEL